MSASDMWKLCCVKIGAATTIGQIVDEDYSDEIESLLAVDSASQYARAVSVGLEDVRISFSTTAIKTALAKVGLAGVNLADDNCVAYFAKFDAGGGLDANGCVTITLAKGVGLWRGLEAPDGALATASFECIGVSSDGSTHPAVLATAQDLPTIATQEMYVAGGSSGIRSISVDTGISPQLLHGDDDIFYTDAAVGAILPTVEYTQTDLPSALGPATNLAALTLQDCTAGGGRGSSPITLTLNEHMGNPSRLSGGEGMTTYQAVATYDGTNAPIVLAGLS